MKYFLIVMLLLSGTAKAQDPFYYVINKSNGLPSASVYDIYQDSKGFMWFATDNGLCRYDGFEFLTYASTIQTSNAGSCIKEDMFGRIWYNNFDGYLYYVEDGVLKSLKQQTSVGYIKYGIIGKHLYLVQKNAVKVFDLETLEPKTSIKINDSYIEAAYCSKNKFYVLGKHLTIIDKNNNIESSVPFTHPLNSNFRTPIISETNDAILISSKFSNNFYIYQNGNFSRYTYNINQTIIQNTAFINGNTWLCTPNGIIKYNITSAGSKLYFENSNISFIYKDKQNNHWISTLNNGLMLIRNFENIFLSIPITPNLMVLQKNKFVIGTEKDLLYNFDIDSKKLQIIYNGKSNHPVKQLIADTVNDKIYFTSSKFRILNKKGVIETGNAGAVKDVKKIDDTYYSFASSGLCGLIKVNKLDSSYWSRLMIPHKKENEFVLLLNNINGKATAYNSYNQCLYYATNNGFMVVTPKTINNLFYKDAPIYFKSLHNYQNKIIGLSNNQQLYEIDSSNDITQLQLPNEINETPILKCKIQGEHLFLFTKNNIIDYNFANKKFNIILPISNELEVLDINLYRSNIYFLTSTGLMIKNYKTEEKFEAPQLFVNYIKVNGQKIKEPSLLHLPYNANEIIFNFSTISYTPNEKYSVLYKINNNNWGKLNADNKNLLLSSLSPGKYIIQLKIDGIENAPVLLYSLIIKKPFWLSTPFLLSTLLLICLILWLLYKRKVKKIEKHNNLIIDKINLEKNLNLSKLKAIKSQMNPHFFYNALNTIQSYILSNEKKQAVNYLSKFSILTRAILEMSDKETISLTDEIKTLSLYLAIEKARFNDDFEYHIFYDDIPDIEHIKIPTLLLQPYIENAVKHGLLHKNGPKKLNIAFIIVDCFLQISIDDNGIGIKKSNEINAIKNKNHVSFATEAMQTRIDLLNMNNEKKISIKYVDKTNEAGNSLGTTVMIQIPINKNTEL